MVADGTHVAKVKEMTNGLGVEAVIDFVGEQGAQQDAVAMLRRAGSDYIVDYGGNLNVPTLDIISTEINFIGNLVGTYNDLAELMSLTAQGKVKLHTAIYSLDAALDAIHDLSQTEPFIFGHAEYYRDSLGQLSKLKFAHKYYSEKSVAQPPPAVLGRTER